MLRGSVAHTALHRFFSGLPKELGGDRVDADAARGRAGVPRARASTRRSQGVRMEMTELAAPRARAEPVARPRGARPRRGRARRSPLVPRRFEVSFGAERSAPGAPARARSRDGLRALREDRPDRRRPVLRPRDRPGLQVRARRRTRRRRSRRSCGSRSRSTCSSCATSSGSSRSAASTGRSRASGRPRGPAARGGQGGRLPGFARERLPRRGRVLGAGRGRARPRARARASGSAAGDVRHDPRRRRVPDLVRAVADVPGEARVTTRRPNAAAAGGDRRARARLRLRRAPAPARRRCSSSASSRAVCERGVDVDSILVITYTRARRRRAARAGSGRALRELGRARPRPRPRRRLDLDDPRLLPPPADGAPVRGRPRPALPRARREPGRACSAGEAFEAALERVLRRRRARAAAAARHLRRRRPAADADRRLRDAARRRAGARARARRAAPPRGQRSRSCATAARVPRGRSDATEAAARRRRAGCSPRRAGAAAGAAARPQRPPRVAASARRRYEEARKAVEQAALDELAARDRDLLQELLDGFAAAYAAAKERESALDFEDLQLDARDLLRDHEAIRERERLRFRAIMVDEFQDTNRLQCELIDLLAAAGTTELFFVGDEFQSIYGFRHADVAACSASGARRRRRRSAADAELPLAAGGARRRQRALRRRLRRRSSSRWRRPASSPIPCSGTPVELLVTDKASYAEPASTGAAPRRRPSRGGSRELVDSGAATPGEIVLLFAAGTDAEWYEEELRSAGLPTYRATGRGYFGQQQVVDLLAYLRLLHNRYDDEALVTVLASPLVGVSNDALVLIRRAAPRRPLFTGLERTLPAELSPDDDSGSARVPAALRAAAAASPRLSLERLCEQIVAEHDYDLAVLAQWDGRRRYANLRKLARLARSYEELRGPDLEGFVRFVARAGGGRREGARGGRGGGGRRRGAAADDPRGEGARVQGRRRRRRRARPGAAVGRRDPRALRRPLRLPGRRSR